MGVLANHVPSIEQLKPGLVEVIEEGGSSKQFFRTFYHFRCEAQAWDRISDCCDVIKQQFPEDLPLSSPTRSLASTPSRVSPLRTSAPTMSGLRSRRHRRLRTVTAASRTLLRPRLSWRYVPSHRLLKKSAS
jgi:hypothetical protein